MKIPKICTFYVLIGIFLIFSVRSFSQKKAWNANIKSLKSIIENNGQFPDINGKKVLFAYLGNSEKFYFTNKGLIIKMDTVFVKKDLFSWATKNSAKEDEEYENLKMKSYYVNAEWENVNNDITIETTGQSSNYYTFRNSSEKSKGYKKIMYKNVYPNINIEYTIPTDSSGIKYNIILNPGADVSDIRLKYRGDVDQILTDGNGNIIIKTPLHNLTEHAPRSYYSDDSKEIVSSFHLQNNIITFNISDSVRNKEVIIDPWVNGINISGDDYGYNVDFDDNNNMYLYTRAYTAAVLYVSKFSPMGTLLWTHLVTTSDVYEGNLMVDRLANKIYISEGFNGTGAQVYRLYDTGVPDGFISQVNSSFVEIWDMAFDVIFNRIIGFGGGTQSNLNGGIINPVTGTVNTANFTGISGICQDIVCGTTDYDGKLFVLYAQTICGTGLVDNNLELVNNTFNGPAWLAPSGFNTFIEASNHILPVNAQSSNAFNALAVNDNYLYYYDGSSLAAYNKLNGTQLATTLVGFMGTMYAPLNQGGIAVDDCDNVYVGGPASNILVYHFDGIAFSQLSQLKLLWMGDQNVFDIKLDRNTSLLYVSGYNNIGVYLSPVSCNLQTCDIDSIVIDDIQCIQNNHFDLNGNIYVSLPQDSIIVSVTDQSSFITQTISPPFSNPVNFSISDIPFSTQPHVISVTISGSIVCGYSVNYSPPQDLTLTGSYANSTCGNNDGFAIVKIFSGGIPPYSYFWSSGISTIGTNNTTDTITGLPAGVYTVTITNSNGCSSVKVFNISDGTLTATVFQNQMPTCNGLCNGMAHVNINGSGLISPYNFEWSNGQSHFNSLLLSDICTDLCAGLVSVTVTDNVGCHAVASLDLNQPLELMTSFTFLNPTCDWSSNGIAFVNVENGLSPYTYLWSNGQTTQMAQNLTAGNYSVTITDSNGCTTASNITLSGPPASTAGFTYQANDLIVQFTNTSTENSIYLWTFGDGTTSSSANPTHTYVSEGTYQVCLTVQNCDTLVACQDITVTLTGVNQINKENISIYPNPAHNYTTLGISQPGWYNVEIIDIAGRLIKSFENIASGEIKINTLEFEKGMYFVKLVNKQAKVIGVTKLSIK